MRAPQSCTNMRSTSCIQDSRFRPLLCAVRRWLVASRRHTALSVGVLAAAAVLSHFYVRLLLPCCLEVSAALCRSQGSSTCLKGLIDDATGAAEVVLYVEMDPGAALHTADAQAVQETLKAYSSVSQCRPHTHGLAKPC